MPFASLRSADRWNTGGGKFHFLNLEWAMDGAGLTLSWEWIIFFILIW